MTKSDLVALARGFAPFLRDLYRRVSQLETKDSGLAPLQASLTAAEATIVTLRERLAVLEVRVQIPGPQGPAGQDGKDGKDAKDGAPGRDGTLEGVTLLQDERNVRMLRADGSELGRLYFDVVLDRGVYHPQIRYEKGDGVTWAGSWWIAQDATDEKPGDGATKWRLAVKAGRDGREGKQGKQGERGIPGQKGEKGDPWRNYQ